MHAGNTCELRSRDGGAISWAVAHDVEHPLRLWRVHVQSRRLEHVTKGRARPLPIADGTRAPRDPGGLLQGVHIGPPVAPALRGARVARNNQAGTRDRRVPAELNFRLKWRDETCAPLSLRCATVISHTWRVAVTVFFGNFLRSSRESSMGFKPGPRTWRTGKSGRYLSVRPGQHRSGQSAPAERPQQARHGAHIAEVSYKILFFASHHRITIH